MSACTRCGLHPPRPIEEQMNDATCPVWVLKTVVAGNTSVRVFTEFEVATDIAREIPREASVALYRAILNPHNSYDKIGVSAGGE